MYFFKNWKKIKRIILQNQFKKKNMYFFKNPKKSIFKKNKKYVLFKKFQKNQENYFTKWKEKSVSAELPLN